MHGNARLTGAARAIRNAADEAAYQQHVGWLGSWWNRISEWPGTANPAPWITPQLPVEPLKPPIIEELNAHH